MRWISVLGTLFIFGYSLWLMLLAYRVVGKPKGADPKFDAAIEYWSGTFKVIGVLGILTLVLQLAVLVIDLAGN
jgi:hypothetical protein